MNGYQRIAAALRGEQPDTMPIMLHNFMMAAREAGISIEQYRSDPRQIARSFIESIERYRYDGILVDVDTATLAGAVGVPVDFPEDTPARCCGPLLRTLEAVVDLAPVDIRNYPGVQVWLEAVRLLKQYFRDQIYIRGNCDQCPFSLAGLMRSLDEWMMDLTDERNSEMAHRLLEYCTGVTAQFIRLMAETGAHMLSNGDSPAGPDMISPRMYRAFALPYEKRIAALAHDLGLPYVLHICGNTNRILEDMVSTGADGLELDHRTDARRAHQVLKDRASFLGNVDPNAVLALGTPQLVEEKTRELLGIFADTPRFILNAGCAIPATTPSENLKAMIRAARER